MIEENIIRLVPEQKDDGLPQYIPKLNKQSCYELSECLHELKFGRPASAQLLLDTLFAMCKRHEKTESTIFDIEKLV